MTLLVAAAMTAVFAWMVFLPVDARWQALIKWGTVPERIANAVSQPAQLLTLVTAIFLHADWLHLLGNLAFLLIFGIAAERAMGSRRFLFLYLFCGVFANLVGALLLNGSRNPIVGASGAVSALIGTYLALFPNARLGLVLPLGLFLEFVRIPAVLLIGLWVLVQLAFSVVDPTFGAVAWVVHLAGFMSGVLFAQFSRASIARRLRN